MRQQLILCLVLAISLTGCAGWSAQREGRTLIAAGEVELGLQKLQEAVKAAPGNDEYRRGYLTQKESVINQLGQSGAFALDQGDYEVAQRAFERILRIEPNHTRGVAGLERVSVSRRHAALMREAQEQASAGNLLGAQDKVNTILRENPQDRRAQAQQRSWAALARETRTGEGGAIPKLKANYRKSVSLAFRDASLTQVFESLKLASGINFVFDKDVRTDARMTLSVTNKALEDVIRVILAGQRLSSRTLDEDSLLIYPNTPEKAKDYQEMVIRTFYLGNADATKMVNLARNVVKVRDVHVDEKLNLLVIRDTAEVVRLAERVIANLDVAEPEVMLELEVLEVSYNRLREIGIRVPDSVSASLTGTASPGVLTNSEWRNRNSGMLSYALSNPLLTANLKQSDGDVTVLSNPRIRIRNKQTAKVLVGERVPVITTTTTANVGTSESVSYLDVGLKLELEPVVALDDEVSMKVGLEVSSITGVVTRSSGLQAYRIGTRNASTILRVRDGETQILAGLIQREDRRSAAGVPFVSDLPLLGRLFSNTVDSDSKSEVVLLITPRVVRNLLVPGPERTEIMAGTESSQGAIPIQLGPGQSSTRPAAAGQPATPGQPIGSSIPPPVPYAPIMPPRPVGPPR